MSESLQHKQLVKLIIDTTILIVGKDNSALIATDAVDGYALPLLTSEGFRPDVHYCHQGKLIIGEAKTSSDIERLHSRKQYESYIKECALFQGEAILLFAVPWSDHATINNIVKKLPSATLGIIE